MACHLIGTKPLLEPMLAYCQLDSKEQTPVKIKSKYKSFIHGNAFESVCKMVAILCRGRRVRYRSALVPLVPLPEPMTKTKYRSLHLTEKINHHGIKQAVKDDGISSHCLGLGNETMVCKYVLLCCYVLMEMFYSL